MGRQGGRPGGGGTRIANCCIRSPLPSTPPRSWGANVLGEPEGPEKALKQRRRRKKSDQLAAPVRGRSRRDAPRQPQLGSGDSQRLL